MQMFVAGFLARGRRRIIESLEKSPQLLFGLLMEWHTSVMVTRIIFVHLRDQLDLDDTHDLEKVLELGLADKMNVDEGEIEESVTSIKQAHMELLNWIESFVKIQLTSVAEQDETPWNSQDLGDYCQQFNEMAMEDHQLSVDLHEAAIVGPIKFLAQISASLCVIVTFGLWRIAMQVAEMKTFGHQRAKKSFGNCV
jgi:hypothetical protein